MRKMKLMAFLLTAALTLETILPGFSTTVNAAELDAVVVETVEEAAEEVVEETAVVSAGDVVEETEAVAEETVVEESAAVSAGDVVEETETAAEETVVETVVEETAVVSAGDVVEETVEAVAEVDESAVQEALAKALANIDEADEDVLCDITSEISDVAESEDGASIMATAKTPSTSAKQYSKANYFYNDTTGSAVFLAKVSDSKLSGVSVVDSNYFSLSYPTGSQYLFQGKKSSIIFYLNYKNAAAFSKLSASEKKAASKVKLQFKTSDGRSWIKEITVSTTKAAPKLKLNPTGSTVYVVQEGTKKTYYGNKMTINLYNPKGKYNYYGVSSATITNVKDKNNNVIFNGDGSTNGTASCATSSDSFTLWFKGDASATAKVQVKCSQWIEPVLYSYKVTVSKSVISPKLSTSKVTLNAAYGDLASMNLSIPKADYSSLTLASAVYKGKGSNPGITIKANGKSITAQCAKGTAKGSYKFEVNLKCNFNTGISYQLKPLTITVNVINQNVTIKDVKIKKTGSTLSRYKTPKNYYVYTTASIKNINATLQNISVKEVRDAKGKLISSPFETYYYTYDKKMSLTTYANPSKVKVILTYTFKVDGTGQTLTFDAPAWTISIVK